MSQKPRLPTLWAVPDDLWKKIEPIIEADKPRQKMGRPPLDRRRVLDGIIFRLRTACQWNQMPPYFGSDSSVHRYFQRWVQNGVFEKIWAALIEECDELGAVQWEWQSADAAMGKARFGGTKSVQTPPIAPKMARNARSWWTATAAR